MGEPPTPESASPPDFDLAAYRATRNHELTRQVDYLQGELERAYQLLAALLLMCERTTEKPWVLILDAACTAIGTNPARAHIHQEPTWP